MKNFVIIASLLLLSSYSFAGTQTENSVNPKKDSSKTAEIIKVESDSEEAAKANAEQLRAMISDKAILANIDAQNNEKKD